jgi:hypothetical protein
VESLQVIAVLMTSSGQALQHERLSTYPAQGALLEDQYAKEAAAIELMPG